LVSVILSLPQAEMEPTENFDWDKKFIWMDNLDSDFTIAFMTKFFALMNSLPNIMKLMIPELSKFMTL
jgi:hypothetical protein